MDPTSLPGRTNPGRVFEMYFNISTINAKEIILKDLEINGMEFAMASYVDYLSHFDTEQFAVAEFLYNNRNNKEYYDLLAEQIESFKVSENYLYYKISSKKKAAFCVRSLEKTRWAVRREHVLVDGKMTKKLVTIAPLYVILLAKAHDSYLSTSSPYINHYGMPVKPPSSMKHKKPWSNTPTKLSGETELRVMATNTCNPNYVTEFISRNSNMESHLKVYYTLLTHKTPTYIEYINTRNEDGTLPDGNPLRILKNILKNIGFKMVTTTELPDDEDLEIENDYVESQNEFKQRDE